MSERQRRSFTEDYKRQAVELVLSSGRSISWLPRNSVCATRCCGAGLTSSGGAGGGGVAPYHAGDADQASEIARLRQENEGLRMEHNILEKSTAIFAGTRT